LNLIGINWLDVIAAAVVVVVVVVDVVVFVVVVLFAIESAQSSCIYWLDGACLSYCWSTRSWGMLFWHPLD